MTTVVVGLSLVASLKTFDIVWGMTKGGPGARSETLALTMYKQTFVANDYGLGAAIALLLWQRVLLLWLARRDARRDRDERTARRLTQE